MTTKARLTGLISDYCLNCSAFDRWEVVNCKIAACPLHPLRLHTSVARIQKASVLKRIKAKCLDCGGASPTEVQLCPVTDCELYPFRFGRDPAPNENRAAQCRRAAQARRTRQDQQSETAPVAHGSAPVTALWRTKSRPIAAGPVSDTPQAAISPQ